MTGIQAQNEAEGREGSVRLRHSVSGVSTVIRSEGGELGNTGGR